MHKFPLLLTATICSAGFTASSAHADIFTNANGLGLAPAIDFEGSTLGVANGTEWRAATGITFDGVFLYVADLGSIFTVAGASDFYLAGEAGAENVVVSFDESQTRYAMAWGTNPGTSTVTAYLGSTMVEQVVLSTTIVDPSTAFLVVENIAFDRIEISIEPTHSVVNSFAIDNVQLDDPPARLGASYCTTSANSHSASGAMIFAMGSTSLSTGSLTLAAENVPSGLGLFFFGPDQTNVQFGDGSICVGGPIVRMPVQSSQAGVLSHQVDFSAFGSDFATLGTVNFQAWFRDPAAGGAGFNFSDGVEIQFVP